MKIVLARHGKLVWDFRTPIPGNGLRQWLQGEDAAPLDPSHRPGSALEELIARATCVIASPLRRSIDSVRLLAPSKVPLVDAHFREAALPCAIPFGVRLRPAVWTLVMRAAWFCGWSCGVESFNAARDRAARAAAILAAHAETHDVVALVGHGIMNVLIAGRLRSLGWNGPRFPPHQHWAFGVYETVAA